MRKIELLSPAKTPEHGIEAVNHGADAVYIGAPRFSARANAANTIEGIECLVKHAHQYYAKVYVALNTILTDKELAETEPIINQLYNIGVDALIIQDMGITQLNLPPIPLHASTQMDNRTVEKVQFLEKAGFEQVVLARELCIDKIREIHQQTNVNLEVFVHGALCVCYSGQCYLSQKLCNRSANRGVCAQMCRLPYSLVDATGKTLLKDKFLLSLKDFNLSIYLKELIEAGASSLKIEGRLKDIEYVKNVTAFYRQRLDAILDESDLYGQSSSGSCSYTFIPNIEKSFHRGSTDYFLHGRTHEITSFDTPKSLGEKIGKVKNGNGRHIFVDTDKELANGDGFAFLDRNGQFRGFKANTVEGNKICLAEPVQIAQGTIIYRNFDQSFDRLLKKKSADRKISTCICMQENSDGFSFQITDEDGISSKLSLNIEKEPAQNADRQTDNIIQTLKKTGNTIFSVDNVVIQTSQVYFIPSAQLSDIRRNLISLLEETREKSREKANTQFHQTYHPYIVSQLDYRGNVHNHKAEDFYKQHEVTLITPSFETKEPPKAELMRCKYCIRYAIGACPKESKATQKLKEPLSLITNTGVKLSLVFDCKNCEMVIQQNQSDTSSAH